jgi:hypothetical protein
MKSPVEVVAPSRLGTSFRWLLGATWVSNVGDGFAIAAGPLLVASLTSDPFLISLAAMMRWAPPLAFGLSAGALVGTVGLAAEWGWSHVWMPIPWPSELLPEAAALGFVTAVAAGAVGGFVGGAFARDPCAGPAVRPLPSTSERGCVPRLPHAPSAASRWRASLSCARSWPRAFR